MKPEDFERLKAVCKEDGIDFCDFLEKTIKNAIANSLQEKLDLLEKKDPRVKERVKGNYVKYHILWPNDDGATLGFSFSGFADKYGALPIEKLDDAGKFLAKQLEEYLNKE